MEKPTRTEKTKNKKKKIFEMNSAMWEEGEGARDND